MKNNADVSPAVLTVEEIRIVSLVALGATNKTVAWQLRTSESAVKSALHTIYRKLKISESQGNPRVLLSLWARTYSSPVYSQPAEGKAA